MTEKLSFPDMNKMYLINFCLMEKIADKKNGITAEDATAYISGVELFFICLILEFLIIRLLPFKVSNLIMFGAMAIIWYCTHYEFRKTLKGKLTEAKIIKQYKNLEESQQKKYLILSIIIFFAIFLIFFAATVWTIGSYDKRWS